MKGSLELGFPLSPRTAMRTLLRSENLSLVLRKPITSAYCSPRLSAIRWDSRLRNPVALGPIPPVVEKTSLFQPVLLVRRRMPLFQLHALHIVFQGKSNI